MHPMIRRDKKGKKMKHSPLDKDNYSFKISDKYTAHDVLRCPVCDEPYTHLESVGTDFLSMADAARKNVGGSEFGKVRQKVLTEIIEAGERGMTQREMGRKFKGMKPKELAETIKALDASGEIALLNITTKGRPRQAFVAIAEVF